MNDLPHGTVTLLFTDVEGSTQLQHVGEEAGAMTQKGLVIAAISAARSRDGFMWPLGESLQRSRVRDEVLSVEAFDSVARGANGHH